MQMFHNATIDCDEDTAQVYEYILAAEADDSDEPERLEFPLGGVQVTHMGGRVSIMLPQPGKAALTLDRLVRAAEAKKQPKGESYVITGTSERLHMQGLEDEDATVTFTIKEWSKADGDVT